MRTVISILQRVLVNHFYKANAGFFAFLFFLLFGMPNSVADFHLALINGIIKSNSFLFVAFALWTLYNLKCINYTSKYLKEEKQNVLFTLNSLPVYACWLYMVYVQVMIYMPVLLYALAIVIVAIQKHYYSSALYVVLFNIASLLLPAIFYLNNLQKKQGFILLKGPLLRIYLSKSLPLIPLFFLWHQRKEMLLVTKFFSFLALSLFIKLYEPDHYDIRPLLLCCMVCATAHSAIIFEVREFEEQYLSFSRNLPFAYIKRFAQLLLMNFILLLPELLFLWKGYPLHFNIPDYFQLLLMMISLLCLFYSVLLTGDILMDAYVKIVFGILAGLFFVVLYNPGIFLPCLVMIISFGFYFSYYYDYERQY